MVDREVGRAWLECAKRGDAGGLAGLLEAHRATFAGLLVGYRGVGGQTHGGKGISLGFIGHTALHWACAVGGARGEACGRLLLGAGADADARNEAGGRPLHTAVSKGHVELVRVLLHEGGADPDAPDAEGETPQEAADAWRGDAGTKKAMGDAMGLERARRELERLGGGGGGGGGAWPLKTVRRLLAHAGADARGCVEKSEFEALARAVVAGLPPRIRRGSAGGEEGGLRAAEAAAEALEAAREMERMEVAEARRAEVQRAKASGDPWAGWEESSDEEADGGAGQGRARAAEAAKAKGNGAFGRGDYAAALKHYSMAVRLSPAGPDSHVYWANRSAAQAGVGDGTAALADANAALRLKPDYAKAHGRRATALRMLGRDDEAQDAEARAASGAPPDGGSAARARTGTQGAEGTAAADPKAEATATATATATAAATATGRAHANADAPQVPEAAPVAASASSRGEGEGEGEGSDSSSDGEDEGGPGRLAELAKAKGNKAFSAGLNAEAARHYSMAIRLDGRGPQGHVYYSNRCAARLALRDGEGALDDAEECLRLRPEWAKGKTRLAAALMLVNVPAEALAVYEEVLRDEPGNVAAAEGRAQAEEAVRRQAAT